MAGGPMKEIVGAGLHILFDVFPFWGDPGSCSPGAYAMILSTFDMKQWENDQKNKMAKNHFSGAIQIPPLKPPLDTLGTIFDPGKVIFGHFIEFGHFAFEIPIGAKKNLGRAFQLS